MIKNGELYARYDVKKGRSAPEGFIPAQEHDAVTGHWPGWVKCDRDDSQWKWHFEAFDDAARNFADGTYELCGPKIQNNPDGYNTHVLIPHGQDDISDVPRTFSELKEWLQDKDIEGIVWHHPDGRMVKIKKKDFGLSRK